MAKLIAKTYGEALFELSLEDKTLDNVHEEAAFVLEVFRQNEELSKLLNHPKVSREEKISVIETVFKGRFSDTIVGFLVIIVEKGRYNDLDHIFSYFLDKVREHKNIGVAYVTTAAPLSDMQKEQVKAKLLSVTKYLEFEMIYQKDTSLIGGMVVRIGDRVLDSSIKSRIAAMAKELDRIHIA